MTADIRKEVLTSEQGQFAATARFHDEDGGKKEPATAEGQSSDGTSDSVGRHIQRIVERDSKNRMLAHLLSDEIKRIRGQRSKLTVKLESLRKNTVLATTELAAMENAMRQFLSLQKEARVRSIRDAESILENLRSTLDDETKASKDKEALLGRLRIECDLLDEQCWTLRQKVGQKPQKVNVVPVIKVIENNFERDVMRVLQVPSIKATSPIVFAKEIVSLKDRYNTTETEYKILQEKLQFLTTDLQNRQERMSRRQKHRSVLEMLPLASASELEQLSRQRVYIQSNIVKNANVTDAVSYASLLGPETIPRQFEALDVWARNLNEWALTEIDNGRQLIKQLKHDALMLLNSEGIKHRLDELHQLQTDFGVLEHRLCELTEENERLWIQLNCELRHLPHERVKIVKMLKAEKKTVTVEKGPSVSDSDVGQRQRYGDTIDELRKIRVNQNNVLNSLRNELANPKPTGAPEMFENLRSLQEKLSSLTKKRAELLDSLNKPSKSSEIRVPLIDHPHILNTEQNICQLNAYMKYEEQRALNATQKLRQLQHALQSAVRESDICREDLPHKEEVNRRLFQRLQNALQRMKEVKRDVIIEKERARFYLPVQASRLVKRIPTESEIPLQDVLEETPDQGLTFSQVMDSEYTKPPTACYETRAAAPHTFSTPSQSARDDLSGRLSEKFKASKDSRSAEEKSKETIKTETETVETESVTGPRRRLMTVNVNCSDIRVRMETHTLPALVRKKITRSTEIKTTEIEKAAEKMTTKSSSRSRQSSRGSSRKKSAASTSSRKKRNSSKRGSKQPKKSRGRKKSNSQEELETDLNVPDKKKKDSKIS